MSTRTTLAAAAVALAGSAAIAVGAAPAASADTYGDMFAAVDWLANKYGVVVYTQHAPLAYGTYAITSGDVITFNSGYVNNPAILERDIAADVAAGYHPGTNCTAAQFVAAHEFAHVLDNLTGNTAQAELVNALSSGMTGTVSGYAVTSPAEAVAESFAAVECDVPTPAESAIYVMLTT